MSNKAFTSSLAMLLVCFCVVGVIYSRPVPVVAQTNLEKIPVAIGEYFATEDSFSESVYRELNADKHIYRHYRGLQGNQVDLYIGYYGTAKGGRTGHNPYACLPGAGWAIVESKKVGIRNPSQSMDAEVNYVHARRNGFNTIMLHWYQTAGSTVLVGGIQQNIERFWGRLLRNRNDGAFVQVTSQVPDEMVTEAGTKVQNFAEKVIQLLPGYWPVEK